MRRKGVGLDLKIAAVEKYKRGEGSLLEICKRFSIRSNAQLGI